MGGLPNGYVSYGSHANCTLAVCPVEWSILTYQPSIPASAVFIALFTIGLAIHAYEGIRWRHTLGPFAVPIILGCIDEIIGYAGRIIMHDNPFSFAGFLMQIICITTAPVFFCASIYVTLTRVINFLDRSLARFNPKILLFVFIPSDVIALVFQAAGGAISSTSTGQDNVGLSMSLFGLSFQVFSLVVFILLSADYLIRYFRKAAVGSTITVHRSLTRFRFFLGFLGAAVLLILTRCVYRIDELSEGYNGSVFHDEGLFYGLESAMIVAAVFCMTIGQPGFGLQDGGFGPHHHNLDGAAGAVDGGSVSEIKTPSV